MSAAANERKRAEVRTSGELARRSAGLGDVKPFLRTVDPAAALARLRAIPPDTRDLTARTFGDPLAGRSALDRKRGEAKA